MSYFFLSQRLNVLAIFTRAGSFIAFMDLHHSSYIVAIKPVLSSKNKTLISRTLPEELNQILGESFVIIGCYEIEEMMRNATR